MENISYYKPALDTLDLIIFSTFSHLVTQLIKKESARGII